MLLFGHLGLTLGAAWVLGHSYDKLQARRYSTEAITNKLHSLASKIDYRVVLIGSMLPDIIDKPLGLLILHGEYGGGRSFFHTLLFALLLLTAGLIWHRRKQGIVLLTLAFANIMHLILDGMWTRKETLLWPFLRLSFYPSDVRDIGTGLSKWWSALLTNPATYIPEIVGVSILSLSLLTLICKKKASQVIRKG